MLERYEGLVLLIGFGAAMIALVWLKTHAEKHADGFLVADRQVGILQGSLSIAVSWVWAPAIFVASLQAYTNGIAGAFWFIVPNIVCFFLFAVLAVRLRRQLPEGYTLPQYIGEKFQGNSASHIVLVIGTLTYLGTAIIANANAGGMLLHAVSGIDTKTAILGTGCIALSYSLLSGLKASIFTDILQMVMVLGLAGVLIPIAFTQAGGFSTYLAGLGGVDGTHSTLFDIGIALSFGIPATITLMTGPISDQMFIQRAFAVRQRDIVKTFVFGGLLFGLVPLMLSTLGFLGAALEAQGAISVENPEMVAPVVIHHLLPRPALYAFVLMAFAGLCSTLDSALCAVSSIGGVDLYRRYRNPSASEQQLLAASRYSMLVIGGISIGIALLEPKILWLFMINGAVTATMFFPIVLSLYWKRMTGAGVALGVSTGLLIGLPCSVYANIQNDSELIVIASIASLGTGLLVSVLASLCSKKPPSAGAAVEG
ncbi:hypothetical protein MRY87_03575 [bacterium]|nr:hypothetical protein [bacterium]